MEKFTTQMNERAGDPVKGAIYTLCICAFCPIVIAATFMGVWAFTGSIADEYQDYREGLVKDKFTQGVSEADLDRLCQAYQL